MPISLGSNQKFLPGLKMNISRTITNMQKSFSTFFKFALEGQVQRRGHVNDFVLIRLVQREHSKLL